MADKPLLSDAERGIVGWLIAVGDALDGGIQLYTNYGGMPFRNKEDAADRAELEYQDPAKPWKLVPVRRAGW